MSGIHASRGPRPELTVLVTTYLGHDRIRQALDSLAAQTLAPEAFEILVVQNGPECPTPQVLRGWQSDNPRHRSRILTTTRAGLSHARNVGVQAARGEHITYLDDDDWVTPSYLSALLEATAPGVIPVAPIGDVAEGVTPEAAVPDLVNYYAARLVAHAGTTIRVDQALSALSVNAGKLMPTATAQQLRYDETLRSGEDFVFWAQAYAAQPFNLRVVGADSGAVYVRTLREGSLGRQPLAFDFNVTQRLDCIERLQSIPGVSADIRRLTQHLITAQATHINGYLRRHPEDHSRVVEECRRRGLLRLPWAVVNRGLARDLAILYCFTPYLDTSGLVAARRLRERGIVTDVISQEMDNIRSVDRSSNQVAAEVLDRTLVLKGGASFSYWPEVRSFTEKAVAAVSELEVDKGSYRSVYSRAMAVSSHFAAAVLKLRRPDIVWTAEFSDPLLRNPQGEDRVNDMHEDWLHLELRAGLAAAGFEQPDDVVRLFEWSELVAYALADEIVFTNEHQMEFMLGYCRDPMLAERARSIASVSHHPTLPPEFYAMADDEYELDDDRVNIAYFGVFYASRGLTEVTEAMQQLSLVERMRIRLHVFTDRVDDLAIEVLRTGMADLITVRPYVPFLQFLSLTKRFDVLLVNDASTAAHHGINPYLPSKLSDYRGSGTPIWAIHEAGSVLSGITTEYSSLLGDVEGAVAAIRRMIGDAGGQRSTVHLSGGGNSA